MRDMSCTSCTILLLRGLAPSQHDRNGVAVSFGLSTRRNKYNDTSWDSRIDFVPARVDFYGTSGDLFGNANHECESSVLWLPGWDHFGTPSIMLDHLNPLWNTINPHIWSQWQMERLGLQDTCQVHHSSQHSCFLCLGAFSTLLMLGVVAIGCYLVNIDIFLYHHL